MKEEEIILDGEKIKVITKLPAKEEEDNNLHRILDDTIDLKEVIEEIKNDK